MDGFLSFLEERVYQRAGFKLPLTEGIIRLSLTAVTAEIHTTSRGLGGGVIFRPILLLSSRAHQIIIGMIGWAKIQAWGRAGGRYD